MKKTALLIFFLTLSLMAFGQDTTLTVKTINKDRQIKGYLICYVIDNKTVKTKRVDTFEELTALNVLKKAKARVYLNEIPTDKLKEDEYLKNGAKK